MFSAFPNMSDTKKAASLSSKSRGLKFFIQEEDGLNYL